VLNQEYEWSDVRYQINRRISYDVDLSFNGRPSKELLPAGTELYRLDFPVVFGIFMKVWWMKEAAFRQIFDGAASSPSVLRQEWQNSLALRKPGKGAIGKLGGRTGEAAARTQVVVIMTTEPVYAWVGIASPLFHKAGGAEQVYLPNLARGSGPERSEYARRLRSYTVPVP
jgi:hypothetical protein